MKQPTALQLAEKMKSYSLRSGYAWHCHKAADELIRLHEANQAMLIAAKEVLASFDHKGDDGWMRGDLHSDEYAALEAAIAKGEAK